MTVRKSSWHYRLWKLGRAHSTEPRDLCRYFWHIVLLKLVAPATVTALVLFGIGALAYLIWGHPVETGIAISGLVVLVGISLVIAHVGGRVHTRHKAKKLQQRFQPAPEPKEPSVLWEYLKARKRKLCPLIKVIDD